MIMHVAIVDYGLGNLFSVKHACRHAGLDATITSDARAILAADATILPGVGAFGDAMETLRRLDLVRPLQDAAASGKPLLGVCLGAQLLLSESREFGQHAGLGVFPGEVLRLEEPREGARTLKVPEIGWNAIRRPSARAAPGAPDPWAGTFLEGLPDGEPMYFVHSYYLAPADPSIVLCRTAYGHIDYCSGMRRGEVTALQFHPERSGAAGLRIYARLADRLRAAHASKEEVTAGG